MPIHPWLIAVLLLAAGGAALAASFYWTVRRRDLTRRPEERQVGFGFKKTLLIYQPSNRGRINAIAWELARSLAKAGHTVTLNVPSPVLSYDPEEYDLLVFGGSAYLGAVGRPLKIDREKEAVYRRAEKEVNALVSMYKTSFRAEPEDYLAMAALGLAVNNVEMELSRSLGEDIDRLVELDKELDQYINNEL